jgi:hypothetical protein
MTKGSLDELSQAKAPELGRPRRLSLDTSRLEPPRQPLNALHMLRVLAIPEPRLGQPRLPRHHLRVLCAVDERHAMFSLGRPQQVNLASQRSSWWNEDTEGWGRRESPHFGHLGSALCYDEHRFWWSVSMACPKIDDYEVSEHAHWAMARRGISSSSINKFSATQNRPRWWIRAVVSISPELASGDRRRSTCCESLSTWIGILRKW